jgi:telomerase reverse transcriptase
MSLLLRLVDDFLFISSSRAAAEGLACKLHGGFPDYNCSINHDKTRLNFTLQLPGGGGELQPGVWRDGLG